MKKHGAYQEYILNIGRSVENDKLENLIRDFLKLAGHREFKDGTDAYKKGYYIHVSEAETNYKTGYESAAILIEKI